MLPERAELLAIASAIAIAALALTAVGCVDPPGSPRPDSAGDSDVIRFSGFGSARFGDTEESIRNAWGHPLAKRPAAPGASCVSLVTDPPSQGGPGLAFMLEGGRFVRYDVMGTRYAAPGDIVVGDPVERVRAAHAGRIEDRPHKYLEGGRTLTVRPVDGTPGRLVFEMGPNGSVLRWRIGIEPQIHYVEGCS